MLTLPYTAIYTEFLVLLYKAHKNNIILSYYCAMIPIFSVKYNFLIHNHFEYILFVLIYQNVILHRKSKQTLLAGNSFSSIQILKI